MKNGIFDILKARFLINEEANAAKNWRFIIFILFLAIIMIGSNNSFDQKVFKIVALTTEVKELRSEFVDRRSELMKLKMESTISIKMEERGIFSSPVPPVKIKVKEVEGKNFLERIWK